MVVPDRGVVDYDEGNSLSFVGESSLFLGKVFFFVAKAPAYVAKVGVAYHVYPPSVPEHSPRKQKMMTESDVGNSDSCFSLKVPW